ncbi:hypothetical protein V8G54_012962 [Vigna mungo]|uniref:Uncharacterized protein n=1 Tax=Vigna mungo TaxID=3915 RepID=A0AAQ3NUS0_VIGMU
MPPTPFKFDQAKPVISCSAIATSELVVPSKLEQLAVEFRSLRGPKDIGIGRESEWRRCKMQRERATKTRDKVKKKRQRKGVVKNERQRGENAEGKGVKRKCEDGVNEKKENIVAVSI